MNYLQDSDGNTITIPEDIELNRRVINFLNFSVAGDFSSDFEISNDSEHRRILGYNGLNQLNKIIQKPFYFFLDGIKISTGRVFLRGVSETFDLFFIAGNGNWMNQITGTIRDLDFSDYDLELDATTIDSRKNATDGVIFPLVDWCYNYKKLTNVFVVKPISGISVDTYYEFNPCFHQHTILKRLFQSYGIILSGNLIDDTIYNSLILTPEQLRSSFYDSPLVQTESMTAAVEGNGVSAGDDLIIMASGTSAFRSSDSSIVIPFTSSSCILTYTLTCSRQSFTGANQDFKIKKNGVTIDTQTFFVNRSSDEEETVVNRTVDVGAVSQGDYLQLFVDVTGATLNVLAGGVTVNLTQGNVVYVSQLLPNMDQFEFVQHIAQRFNCLIEFDDDTQTITFTKLDSISPVDAVDLSDKMDSYTIIPPSGYAEKNYLRTEEAEELSSYKSGSLNYGDAVIESDGDGERDIITTPFAPAETFTNQQLDWLITNVPLVRLEDADDGVEYVAVQDPTGISGKAEFTNGTVFVGYVVGSVVRIQSTSGEYEGFAVIEEADTSGLIVLGGRFGSTDTGRIYKQKIVFPFCKSRELIVVRGLDVNDINTGSPTYGSINLKIQDDTGTYPYADTAWAFYAKPNISTDLDYVKVGLNYGPVVNTSNIPFGKIYHKNLGKIVRGSQVQASVYLAQHEYKDLNFKKFVFLETPDFKGYFFINSTESYQNRFTPVQLNLIYMNGN